MWRRLQPYVMEAATLCGGGCNPIWAYHPRLLSSSSVIELRRPSTSKVAYLVRVRVRVRVGVRVRV